MKRELDSAASGNLANVVMAAEALPTDKTLEETVGGMATRLGAVSAEPGGSFVDICPDDPMIAIRKIPAERQPETRDSRVFITKRTPKGREGQKRAVVARLGIRGFMAPG